MTPTQIEIVQTSWEKVVPIGKDAAALFYGQLFKISPSYKALFPEDTEEQGKKLMTILTTVVRGLKNLPRLEETVWQLGRRHTLYGVNEMDYSPVAEALLWTLRQGLGNDYTDDVNEAWTAAYTTLAGVMLGGANSEYANYSVWKELQAN